jgi:AraC family transcriptional regulator, arabinose operon regulatory protein
MAVTPRSGPKAEIRSVSIYKNGPRQRWVSKRRGHYNLWIAVEGAAVFERGGVAHNIAAGAAMLLRPEEEVQWVTGERSGLVNFAAHLAGEGAAARHWDGIAGDGVPVDVGVGGWALPLCRQLSSWFYLDETGGGQGVWPGIELLLLALQRSRRRPTPNTVDQTLLRMVERIRADPAARVSVEALAEEAGLSASQFTRRFRAFTGVSPARFVIGERLRRAEADLLESDWSIETIAERCGYADVYFFSRQFRQFRGMPPSERRRRGQTR